MNNFIDATSSVSFFFFFLSIPFLLTVIFGHLNPYMATFAVAHMIAFLFYQRRCVHNHVQCGTAILLQLTKY